MNHTTDQLHATAGEALYATAMAEWVNPPSFKTLKDKEKARFERMAQAAIRWQALQQKEGES